jgi:hypothetical protein
MKRLAFAVLIVLGMTLMGAVPVRGQQVVSPDGSVASMDNLGQEKVPLPWQVEVSVRQVATIGWMPELVTVGMRKGDLVFGLGSGHGMITFDAHPAQIRYIPVFAYNRIYFPLGSRKRFSFYSDALLGYQTIYKVVGNTERLDTKKGDGNFLISWQPGISLRMWGKSNLFLGLTVTSTLEYIGVPLLGLHLGLAF